MSLSPSSRHSAPGLRSSAANSTENHQPRQEEKPMSVPQTNQKPPFRFRRTSHAVLTSRDLSKSKEFYTEVIGLVASDQDRNTLYLRGLEERGHHSLAI